MNNPENDRSKNNHRRQVVASMGIGVALGIILGAALGNIGLGLATGAKQLIIVGGIEYSRDPSWVLKTPIEDDNIAYASHIYPAHGRYSWDLWFGNVSKLHPVVMTEWGWMESDPSGEQEYLVGSQKTYGDPLMEYLDQHGIGWVAGWYDDEWKPAMFEDGIEQFTPFGQFVLQRLSGQ